MHKNRENNIPFIAKYPDMEQAECLTIYTQFYYKSNRLYFQILIPSDDHSNRLVGEFDDYESYTKAYDQLQIKLMEQAERIFLINEQERMEKVA